MSFEISIDQVNKTPLKFTKTSDLDNEEIEIKKEQELINRIWQNI